MTLLIVITIYLIALPCLGNGRERWGMLLTGLDAFLFALACFGNVKQGECASSAAWDCLLCNRWQGRIFVPMIDTLFRSPGHCERSWQWQQHLYQAA